MTALLYLCAYLFAVFLQPQTHALESLEWFWWVEEVTIRAAVLFRAQRHHFHLFSQFFVCTRTSYERRRILGCLRVLVHAEAPDVAVKRSYNLGALNKPSFGYSAAFVIFDRIPWKSMVQYHNFVHLVT
jgi:hypothetical protein